MALFCSKYFLWCLALSACLTLSHAQRFLRDSGHAGAQVRAEMELGGEDLGGMSREMFLMKDRNWELLPPDLDGVSRNIRSHILKYLKGTVKLSLQKKQGKYGMRAIGRTEAGQKLRACWRQSPPGSSDKLGVCSFLEAPYDTAVRSRLSMVEFEVQLPPTMKGNKLPSVVYSIAIEPGSMNPKGIVLRGAGKIRIYQDGREGEFVEAEPGNIGLSTRAGLVDPTWAKGKANFRQGRQTGVM